MATKNSTTRSNGISLASLDAFLFAEGEQTQTTLKVHGRKLKLAGAPTNDSPAALKKLCEDQPAAVRVSLPKVEVLRQITKTPSTKLQADKLAAWFDKAVELSKHGEAEAEVEVPKVLTAASAASVK